MSSFFLSFWGNSHGWWCTVLVIHFWVTLTSHFPRNFEIVIFLTKWGSLWNYKNSIGLMKKILMGGQKIKANTMVIENCIQFTDCTYSYIIEWFVYVVMFVCVKKICEDILFQLAWRRYSLVLLRVEGRIPQ